MLFTGFTGIIPFVKSFYCQLSGKVELIRISVIDMVPCRRRLAFIIMIYLTYLSFSFVQTSIIVTLSIVFETKLLRKLTID